MNEADAHLLIVDDDERIRTLLQKFLRIFHIRLDHLDQHNLSKL